MLLLLLLSVITIQKILKYNHNLHASPEQNKSRPLMDCFWSIIFLMLLLDFAMMKVPTLPMSLIATSTWFVLLRLERPLLFSKLFFFWSRLFTMALFSNKTDSDKKNVKVLRSYSRYFNLKQPYKVISMFLNLSFNKLKHKQTTFLSSKWQSVLISVRLSQRNECH